jgi:3-hydroxymyristoyl/3-hydroxydecanoyl-(acyl carrier protein) dehydratase
VTQIDWALRLAQRYFPIDGRFSGIRQLKFQRILQPDDNISLTLRFLPEEKELSFVYTSEYGECSQGRAVFAHPIAASDGAS